MSNENKASLVNNAVTPGIAVGALAAGLAYHKYKKKNDLYNKYGLKNNKNNKYDKDTIYMHARDAAEDILASRLKEKK